MNNYLKILLSALIFLSYEKPQANQTPYDLAQQVHAFSLLQSNDSKKLDIKLEVKTFDSFEQAAQQTSAVIIQGQQNLQQTTIISSESLAYINEVYKNKSLENLNRSSTFIVYNDSISRFAKSTGKYFKDSYQNDKIGFVIATFTTAIETMVWVHVAPLSTLAMSANIAFTIATALYFRFNKDNWTHLTQKIRTPLQNFLKITNESSKTKNLLLDYAANLSLAMPLSLARVPLMSMNEILDHGISLKLIEMPILLSILGTASFFAWSEHLGSIDKKTHPISKFIFQRAAEIRSVLVATLASTAALLNPGTFGITPWVTLTIIGVSGAFMYLNSKQINQWIESSPLFKKFEYLAHFNSTARAVRCEQLFAQ